MAKKKAILIFSGGMDSTTLLYQLVQVGDMDVQCLTIDYGQRHSKEIACAGRICDRLGVKHFTLDLSSLTPLLGGSSQTDPTIEVPEGHYAEENMKLTVVPNRNMIMLSCAIAWAVSSKADYVAYAAHAGDHDIYPDCRKEFADLMDQAAQTCDWHKVELLRPFVEMDKGDICKLGLQLGVPYEMTWTCYKGKELACGKCGSCTERLEAFEKAGAADPIAYEK